MIPVTIQEMIDITEESEISYRNLHEPLLIHDTKNNTIKVPYMSITNKYRDFLESYVIEYDLSDEEQVLYRYKPKMLSEVLYNTTELWYALLELNDCISIIDFHLLSKKVKIYEPKQFKEIINEILIVENIIN